MTVVLWQYLRGIKVGSESICLVLADPRTTRWCANTGAQDRPDFLVGVSAGAGTTKLVAMRCGRPHASSAAITRSDLIYCSMTCRGSILHGLTLRGLLPLRMKRSVMWRILYPFNIASLSELRDTVKSVQTASHHRSNIDNVSDHPTRH